VGIIDYIRTFTLDKKLEMWIKSSGILGGAGNLPTVVSPSRFGCSDVLESVLANDHESCVPLCSTSRLSMIVLYKERFIEAMSRYFLLVPDCWTSSSIIAFTRNGILREASQGKKVGTP
jgi:1-phosphatidylinositol-3-phosphate 5-kinase